MERNVFDLAQEDTNLKRKSRGEYAGACPSCGGSDRFVVNLNKRDGKGGWMCRYCWPAESKGWGDGIDYLRHFRGFSFQDAKAALSDGTDDLLQRVNKLREEIEPEKWQKNMAWYVERAKETLWTPAGRAGLEYLRSRGLKDETIKAAQLGYVEEKIERNGETIPFIVIPWHDSDGGYSRINKRDIRPGIDQRKRYRNVPGSSNTGLYGCALLSGPRRKYPVMIVEGELDALTIAQAAKDLPVNVVATGGLQCSRVPKWVGKLARVSAVLLAQDNEERGEAGAQSWLNVLSNALRYRPLAKDVNAMLLEGWNVRAWIEAALDLVSEDQDQQSGETSPAQIVSADHHNENAAPGPALASDAGAVCATCGAPSWTITEENQGYCKACWKAQGHAPASGEACCICGDFADCVDEAALEAGEEKLYCSDCWNKHQQQQDQAEQQSTPDQDAGPGEQFLAHVSSIASSVFGPDCSIEVYPAGYLEQQQAQARLIAHQKPAQAETPWFVLPGPRRCPAEHVTNSATPKTIHCNGKPLKNGWCQEHQQQAALLYLGEQLGYPSVQIWTGRDGYRTIGRSIGEGKGAWLAYSRRAYKWAKHDIPLLEQMAEQARQQAG